MKKYNFNENWSFYKDGKEPVMVNLPHDAMLLEKRNPVMPDGSASGYYPGGKYYYVNNLSGEFFGKLRQFKRVIRCTFTAKETGFYSLKAVNFTGIRVVRFRLKKEI